MPKVSKKKRFRGISRWNVKGTSLCRDDEQCSTSSTGKTTPARETASMRKLCNQAVGIAGKKTTSLERMTTEKDLVLFHGGCHCGKIRFQVSTTPIVDVYNCSCSICRKKQNLHFIVPEASFQLLQGEDNLTCYTFNTHKARHLFCKTCGVQSFYKPRSNPNGYGIMPHCIDEDGPELKTNAKYFDGKNWETAIVDNRDILSKSEKC